MGGMRINLLPAGRQSLIINRARAQSLAQFQASKVARISADKVNLSTGQRGISRLSLLLLSPLMLFGIVGMPAPAKRGASVNPKDLAAALVANFKEKCFPNRSTFWKWIFPPVLSLLTFPLGLLTWLIPATMKRTESRIVNAIKAKLPIPEFAKEFAKLSGEKLTDAETARLYERLGPRYKKLVIDAQKEIEDEARQLMRGPVADDNVPSKPSKPPTLNDERKVGGPKQLPDHPPRLEGEEEEGKIDKTKAVRYQKGDKISTAEHQYTIIGHLNIGGFSDVYRVKTTTGKIKAAKVISVKRHIMDQLERLKDNKSALRDVVMNMIQRFEQEYRITKDTKDSHFCKAEDINIYEIFQAIKNSALFMATFSLADAEDKEIIIITEFVAEKPGSPNSAPELTKEIRKGITERRVTNLFLPAMKALHYELHENGFVHRDLKPANMLLPRDANGEEYIKYIDFGTAKDESRKTKLTEFGVPHTPSYQAPRAYEKPDVPPRKIDIYEYGVMWIEALTGQNPFLGMEIPERNKYLEGEKELILAGENAPALYQSIRPELRQIIQRMVSKDPYDNYPTLLEATYDIEVATGLAKRPHSVIDVARVGEVKEAMDKVDRPDIIPAIDPEVLAYCLSLKYPIPEEQEEEADPEKMQKLLVLMDRYLYLMSQDKTLDSHRRSKIDKLQNVRDGLEKEIARIQTIKDKERSSAQSQPDFPVAAPAVSAAPAPEAKPAETKPAPKLSGEVQKLIGDINEATANKDKEALMQLLDPLYLGSLVISSEDARALVKTTMQLKFQFADDLDVEEALNAASILFAQKMI